IAPGSGMYDTILLRVGDRAALSPDRRLIARATAKDKERKAYAIELIDSETGESRRRIDVDRAPHSPVFSPDGTKLYAISGNRYVRGWDVQSGREVMRADVPLTAVYCETPLIVSANGRYLATAERGGTRA